LLKNGVHNFCVVGDVYRKDEIDATHYPVFHQMEAVRLYKVEDLKKVAAEWLSSGKLAGIQGMPFERQNQEYQYFSEIVEGNDLLVRLVVDDLKETHQNLMKFILKDETIQYRWNPDYFPFTEPSFEMEIYLKNRWLEVLGSGIVHKEVLQNAGVDPNKYLGWASGIGLERIAMILFDIPDIRLFWSQDERFLKQFTKDKVSKFKPFSKYPSCFKDIAFYVAKK
jgi:phenylalanyl-tRNA synthetase alpha chain